MHCRTFRVFPALALALVVLSCGGGSDDPSGRLSQVGETCSKTGDCDSGLVCVGAVCQQEGAICPDDKECSGLECGPDPVCGTSCGTCSGDQSCSEGACEGCAPSCGGRECGDDGCGGSCGECSGAGSCQDGGCVSSPMSNLTWQNPPSENDMTWSEAKQYCSDLDVDGHTDWRLPTIGELRSLIRGCPATEWGGSCGVDDDCLTSSCGHGTCHGCSNIGCAGGCCWPDGIQGWCSFYWSSSPVEDDDIYAWVVKFNEGGVNYAGVHNYGILVRCVR